MELTIHQDASPEVLPAMKRAKMLLAFGFFILFLVLVFTDYLSFSLEVKFGIPLLDSFYYISLIRILSLGLLVAGFLQFCYVGNGTYRLVGIILSIPYIKAILITLYSVYRFVLCKNFEPFSPNYEFYLTYLDDSLSTAIFGLGISLLWLSCNDGIKKILATMGCVYLIGVGYGFMSHCISSYETYSSPLSYILELEDSGCVYKNEIHFFWCIYNIICLFLWWKFCGTANPVKDNPEISLADGLTSKPFIALVLCTVVLIAVLHVLSTSILTQ